MSILAAESKILHAICCSQTFAGNGVDFKSDIRCLTIDAFPFFQEIFSDVLTKNRSYTGHFGIFHSLHVKTDSLDSHNVVDA